MAVKKINPAILWSATLSTSNPVKSWSTFFLYLAFLFFHLTFFTLFCSSATPGFGMRRASSVHNTTAHLTFSTITVDITILSPFLWQHLRLFAALIIEPRLADSLLTSAKTIVVIAGLLTRATLVYYTCLCYVCRTRPMLTSCYWDKF